MAAQCCEHLNRALVIERSCAEKYGYEPVAVVPQPKAGGSFATITYENMLDPVVVEHIKAHVGIDIGETLIGMHLKDVAVPLRISQKRIGEANIICAYTRPKYPKLRAIAPPRCVQRRYITLRQIVRRY